MFMIQRIADPRLATRVCGSFGVTDLGAFAYGAFKGEDVLATAAFVTEPGGCVVFRAVDLGRRMDVELADGLARAAFSAQLRAGAKKARLDKGLSLQLRQALSKKGYDPEKEFDLAGFFRKKHCQK